jgi:hypothetical protein
MDFSIQLGRTLLRKRHATDDLATKKWHLILPGRFQFQWNDAWDTTRSRKEAMLIWQLWHKVVAVNAWRGKISPHIDQSCLMCSTRDKETTLHRFWSCDYSQHLWTFRTMLLN